METLNKASFVGRMVRDPELRFTPNGVAVANFTLAMRNPYNQDGTADFINFVAWQKTAELVADKHVKGDWIAVDGRMQSRSYENNDGNTVFVVECSVDNVTLINGRYTDQEEEEQPKQNKQTKQNKNTTNRGNSNQNRGRGSGRQ